MPSSESATKSLTLGLFGARGSVGKELIGLLNKHDSIDLTAAWSGSLAGEQVRAHAPGAPEGLVYLEPDFDSLCDASPDVVALALPNGKAQQAVEAMERSDHPPRVIIDLSADFRFDDNWVYGLTEINRERIRSATRIANPGCYASAIGLTLAPLGARAVGVPHCFGVSGYSGAGSTPSDRNNVERLTGGVLPYVSVGHLHEQEVSHTQGRPIRFAPTVAPFERGIVMTTLFEFEQPTDPDEIESIYTDAYSNEPLIGILGTEIPRVQDVVGTPNTMIGGIQVDPNNPTRCAVVCVLDNLLKGAASQALANINLALGLPEHEGILS